jgi:hypothetical protein
MWFYPPDLNSYIKFKPFLRKLKCDSTLLSFLYIYPFLFWISMQSSSRYYFRHGFWCVQNIQCVWRKCPRKDWKYSIFKKSNHIPMLNIQTNPDLNIYWDEGIAAQNYIWAPYLLKRSISDIENHLHVQRHFSSTVNH